MARIIPIACIYKITFQNVSVYIGQTHDFYERIKVYRYCKCKSQIKIYNLLKKHGFDYCNVEIIEVITPLSLLNEREIYWIEFYKSNFYKYPENNGLNLTDGGSGSLGRILSEDHKRKIQISSTGRKHSEETKKRMYQIRLGTKASLETRKKQSQLWKEKADSNPNYGFKSRKPNKEQYAKMGLTKIGNKNFAGKKHTQENKMRMSEMRKGIPLPEESRIKMACTLNKVVFNKETGIYYFSCKEAGDTLNVCGATISKWLNGERKNNSNMIFV